MVDQEILRRQLLADMDHLHTLILRAAASERSLPERVETMTGGT